MILLQQAGFICRRYAVDGISLHPAWVPSVSEDAAEDKINFNLLLMTGIKKADRASF